MSCIKITELVEKSRSSRLTMKEAISLKIHFLKCPGCKNYQKLSDQMESFINESIAQEKEMVDIKLSDEQKKKLIAELSNI
ncbi:MAG: hypothetical protein ACI9N1_001507 [Flavobacteriales bacterium]|jgi:hypothetical protein